MSKRVHRHFGLLTILLTLLLSSTSALAVGSDMILDVVIETANQPLSVVNGKMYWTDSATGKIQRANLDGTGVEDLVTVSSPLQIALDLAGGKMYWADSATGKIQRANLDGTGVEDLVTEPNSVGIALDLAGGKMYYLGGNTPDRIVQRANLDGTGVESLVGGPSDKRSITLDLAGGKMYWTDATADKIRRANLDGTGVEDLVGGLPGPFGIALDLTSGKMYWTEHALNKIQRANLDGTGVEDLITTGLTGPVGIALDLTSGKMYWTDSEAGKIRRANLDGTGVEDLITGLGAPRGIALGPVTNQPPSVAANNDLVTVNEGVTAGNTGTVSDPDGDTVSLTASVGSVVNNNDGTWSWSFSTSDGPAESQTVTIDADDGNGGTAQTTFGLTVNNVAPTVNTITVPAAPIDINDQPVTGVSATFSDPANTNDETYTCSVDYDDGGGAQAGTVAGTTCSGPNHTFTEAGVYAVTVSITDKDGDSGSATATEFIVVYDPSGGFVTGGGWIDSPAGAYKVPVSVWDQGFETDASGWFDGNSGWSGTVTQVASGTNGTLSSTGDFHAIFIGSGTGPFSRFDGYRDSWPGTFVASVDVYLDIDWLSGQGFDYSVAANGSDGLHQRDYIFHVTSDTSTGKLFVAGSNNTNFAPREDLETINHYEVTSSGWYTFQHVFYDSGGALAVDMNLLDSAGNVLFTETRFTAADTIPGEVGGNRYAWFTVINVDGGIAVDDHQLAIPPVGRATFGFVSKYKKGASIPSGNTEFNFKAGDLNFHSDEYQWLVINHGGTRAQYKGTGTINGDSGPGNGYKFMLWGQDDPTGDTFRIKIWYEDGGEVVIYDNGTDQALGGGNIKVHKGK